MSSYRMQPMLHMSTPWSYSFSIRMISGDLNHLELTWLDRHLYFFAFLTPSFYESFSWALLARLSGRDLARAKSQNFTWQKRFIRMFAGFKSLWMTFAEARNLPAHSMLYKTVLTCCCQVFSLRIRGNTWAGPYPLFLYRFWGTTIRPSSSTRRSSSVKRPAVRAAYPTVTPRFLADWT